MSFFNNAYITGLLVCIGCSSGFGQMPIFQRKETPDIGEKHFTVVFQDDKGWIWCGAEGELFRYSGQSFQPIGMPAGLETEKITAVGESENRLWVGFGNGAIATLPIFGSFMSGDYANLNSQKHMTPHLQLWQPREGLPQKPITGFAADTAGNLWFGTYGEGLYVFHNNRLYQFGSDDGLLSDEIYDVSADLNGNVWAATDGGINICSIKAGGKKEVASLGKAEGLSDEIITSLYLDKKGNIWAGTHSGGICRFENGQSTCAVYFRDWPYGAITRLILFGDHEMWIGSEENGLIRADLSTNRLCRFTEDHPLSRTKVVALCKDREGLLWTVTDKGRLYGANTRFGKLQSSLTSVQTLLLDRKDRLWIGNTEGLWLQNGEEFRPLLPGKQNVIALWQSADHDWVWVGTFGGGVFILDGEGRVIKKLTEADGLMNGSVLSVSGNKYHAFLATLGGVTVVTLDAKGLPRQTKGLKELGSNYVYKVFADSRGRVWFGTDGKGLTVFENGVLKRFTEAAGVELKTIFGIVEDKKGNIWFSSDKDGLFCYSDSGFRRYTTANHLHHSAITGLAADGNGHIVIGYEDGFDILNPDRTDHVTFCNGNIGAPAADVNLNALFTDRQGHVWLGAKQGVVRSAAFNDGFIDDPQPGITDVSVSSHTIDFQHQNTFSYNQNYFIFNFTGLWYTNPESVRYRYKLEGFDPDWKVSKDHLAYYPNLPPGKYRFRVQTSEHGNFENVPEAVWTFTILQPFWTTWWFISLCSLSLLGLIYLVVQTREKQLQKEALLKRENVESQFAALKSQINPHFLFNSFNTLITIIEENPKIAVEYVEHLSDFYRSIIVYRERDFISLEEEIELVENFYFLLQKRYETGLRLNNKLEKLPDVGKIMPLSLQILVENAVKHNVISASRPLTIELYAENDYIVVRNNIQPKIKKEPSTHFGLQSLVNRYQLLGERTVIVEDNVAFFTVKVPIIYNGR